MSMTTSSLLQSISHQMSEYEDSWKRCMSLGGESTTMTQSEFFKKYIPDGKVDFTDIFVKFNLGEIFTSEKVVTRMLGPYNCNMLFRQVSDVPHLLVYSDGNYMAFQPLGEPGRDVDNYKIGHLMVVNYNSKNRFTLSEMLPLSFDEKEDLKKRSDFLKMSYNSLFKNMLVKDCGGMVLEKAINCGLTPTTPIREFLSYQIMHIPKDIKEGKPGYKLMMNGSDISNNLQKVNSEIARVFNKPLKISHYIQGPRFCSQLISHIHGFVCEREEETFGKVFRQTYINLDHIISLRYQASQTPPRTATRSPRSPPRLNLKNKSWCCATC